MKIQLKKILYVLLMLGASSGIYAQDFLLSQLWTVPTYIAPSFAGITGGGKVYSIYRNQWSALKGSQTVYAGYDQFFYPIQSSFGANIAYTTYGGGMLSELEGAIQYNYKVKLTKEWFFRPGLEVGVLYRSIDPTKMTFIDQIAVDGTLLPTTSFVPYATSLVKFDASVSVMVYNEYFMGGLEVSNLLGNKISFTNDAETKQKMKLNTFVVGKIPIAKGYGRYAPKDDVTIAALYQWQGQYHQIDLDVMYHREHFMAGLGYRGIPFMSNEGYTNSDAIKVMLGGSVAKFSISYSYDISVSSLADVSGGTHEIALTYRFLEKKENDISYFCY